MAEPKRLLILGGTGEARALAARAATLDGFHAVSSLAGATRNPARPPGEVRTGGFGGVAGLTRYLTDQRIDLVIDATHPYAAQISNHAAVACDSVRVPLLHIVRPAWSPVPGDRWLAAETPGAAAETCRAAGDRIFVTLGRKDLGALAGLADRFVLLRCVDPPETPPPFAQVETVIGRGPFSLDDELELMRRHRIDCLLCKNSGGESTYAKVAAARTSRIPVVMLKRPTPPAGKVVATVEEAVAWLRAN
jgi:precorrin-6A/cobalt-precorrin-6A reductase